MRCAAEIVRGFEIRGVWLLELILWDLSLFIFINMKMIFRKRLGNLVERIHNLALLILVL